MLGAAITATIAGWGSTEPQFTSRTEITSTFLGGIGGYPANVTNSYGLQSVGSGWSYDTTGGTGVWGVFTAFNMYLPVAALNAATDLANTNLNSTQITLINTEISDSGYYEGIGLRINTGGGGTAGVNNFSFDPRFTGTSWPTTLAKTTIQDRWITVLSSLYDTSANYTGWNPPSGSSGDVYGRLLMIDTVTGAVISQQDQRFNSNTNMFNYWKSNIAYSTSGPSLGFSVIHNTSLLGGSLVANPWVHFGDTIDPSTSGDIYTQWIGFHTPAPGPKPVFSVIQKSTSDYTTSGGVVYVANNPNARVSTASNTPIYSQNTSVQGTLTYL